MVVNDYAFVGALVTGSLLSFWIDKIPLWGTKVPLYGYCSTVVFTEHDHEASVWSNYLTLLLLKGIIYLGLFLFLSKITEPKSKSVRFK